MLTRTLLLFALGFCVGLARSEDNTLTPQETADGWILLFNGKDTQGWKCNNGKPVEAKVEENSLNPYKAGGYVLVYEKPFKDFILECDVKMGEPDCNSGIFVRVGDLADPVQTGFEIQIYEGEGTSHHDFGSIYDLVRPSKNPSRPAHEWNHVRVMCKGPVIAVAVNGEDVASINCDEFTEPGKRPDGSKNKFAKAIKDFPREGYLGFQDHGHRVLFKNVKLKPL